MRSSKHELNDFSVAELEAIDRLCLRFEDDWLAGQSPDISDFLKDANTSSRAAVLAELIRLDVEYRTQRGQSPAKSQYCSVFPDETDAIESAFSDLQNTSKKKRKAEKHESDASREPPFEILKLGNEYKLERFHARGGLGEIFIARDRQLDRMVAIKVPRNRDPGSSERLRLKREAEITGRLKHPGIVPVHAACHENDNMPCYVMQFIEGQTFREAVDAFHSNHTESSSSKFRSWEFRRLLQRLISVCSTVAYVHDQGVIHRDIKPGNIMLGEFGETFLLDWGLAKQVGNDGYQTSSEPPEDSTQNQDSWRFSSDETAASTKPGQPIGTPEFASPEQVQGKVKDQDGRSDIYSLGATLYYLLAGRRAIELEDLTDLSTASAIRNVIPPKSINPNVPADLSSISMKAIAFDAKDRYQKSTDFSDELDRYLADEPILTRQENWPTRARRWMKKSPRTAYSLVTGISVALLALVFSSWFFSQQADKLAGALSTQRETNEKLIVARDSAEAYADKTMNALRTMSNRVIRQWFTQQKSFTENERQLLQEILTQYQEFARSKNNIYSTRIIEAEAFQRVGQIQKLLGRNKEALASYTKATELLTPLPAGADKSVREARTICELEKGKLLFVCGDIQNSLKTMKSAVELFESLISDYPDDLIHLHHLAQAQNKLGSVYVRLNEPELALAQLELAKETTANLVERQPENIEFVSSYAATSSVLGVALHQYEKFDSSIVEHEMSARIYENFENKGEIFQNINRSSGLSMNYIGLAMSLSKLGRTDDALEAFEKGVVASKRFTETYPSFPDAYSGLAAAHHGLTFIYLSRREYDQAIIEARFAATAAKKAVELSPNKRNYLELRSDTQKMYGTALQRSGDLEGAEGAFLECLPLAQKSFELGPGITNRLEVAKAFCLLGRTQYKLDKKLLAFENFIEAIKVLESNQDAELAPHLTKPLISVSRELAKMLFESEELTRSLEYWERVIEHSQKEETLAKTVRAICLAETNPELGLEVVKSLIENASTADQFFNLASAAGRAAQHLSDAEQRSKARDSAIDLLNRARESGFFTSAKQIADLNEDDSFDSIRDDERFAAFSEQLESSFN